MWTALKIDTKTGNTEAFYIFSEGKLIIIDPDEARKAFPKQIMTHEQLATAFLVYR